MKQPYIHGLPSCPMSAHCLRLLDDLDAPSKSQQLEELIFTNDVEDERLVEQLRAHVPSCPTCSVTLAQARRTRAQQRRLLSHVLRDNEQKVPSITPQILAAIRLEQRTAQPLTNNHSNNHHQEVFSLIGELEGRRQPGEQLSSQRQSRTILRNAIALVAVAAIILAAIGIFNRENFIHVLTTGSKPIPTPKETAIPNWGSVVVGLSSASIGAGQMAIMNYDPRSGKRASLVTSNLPANTQIEGVSRDGHNLVYRLSQSGHTHYYTLTSVPKTGFFYELNDSNAGHAIWESDNIHVLIATVNDGVVEVNIQNGASKRLLPELNGVIPAFYYNGYMYFIGGQTGNPAWLYRANTTNGLVQPISQLHSIGAEYLLSPLGSSIYFANKFGPAGQPGLYSVKIDGTNLQPLRAYPDATPIGFAADNSLEFMRQVSGKFQVWKLGATPQQDSVVLADAAPGASSLCNASVNPGIVPICEQNIALSPYGRGMVVHAFYTDDSSKLLFDDLTTGQVQTLQLLPPNTQVQLPGWDQLAVPGSSPLPTATPGPSQNYG